MLNVVDGPTGDKILDHVQFVLAPHKIADLIPLTISQSPQDTIAWSPTEAQFLCFLGQLAQSSLGVWSVRFLQYVNPIVSSVIKNSNEDLVIRHIEILFPACTIWAMLATIKETL